MPVYLRIYYINKINKIFKDKAKAQEKANRQSQSTSSRAKPPKFNR